MVAGPLGVHVVERIARQDVADQDMVERLGIALEAVAVA